MKAKTLHKHALRRIPRTQSAFREPFAGIELCVIRRFACTSRPPAACRLRARPCRVAAGVQVSGDTRVAPQHNAPPSQSASTKTPWKAGGSPSTGFKVGQVDEEPAGDLHRQTALSRTGGVTSCQSSTRLPPKLAARLLQAQESSATGKDSWKTM